MFKSFIELAPGFYKVAFFSPSFSCAPGYTVHITELPNTVPTAQLHTQNKSPTNKTRMENFEVKPFLTSHLNSLI